MNDDALKQLLRFKKTGIPPCHECKGIGGRWYGSGSTWHGGMGTASCEWDVCATCWGSGDAERPWTNIREMEATEERRVAERAAQLFADRCGLAFRSLHPGIRELCDELERFGRGRKKRAYGFDITCLTLGKLLRELCDADGKVADD